MTITAKAAFVLSGGSQRFNHTLSLIGHVKNTAPYSEVAPFNFHPMNIPKAYRFGKYTRNDSLFYAAALPPLHTSPHKTRKIWINYLLGSFITGTQPENILFPPDDVISNTMRNSFITRKALKAYRHSAYYNTNDVFVYYGKLKFIHGFRFIPKIISFEHFVGSAYIIIQQQEDHSLRMAIVNVTSLTSSDPATIFTKPKKWRPSFPRNGNPDPYGNIAQIYQLTFPPKKTVKKP